MSKNYLAAMRQRLQKSIDDVADGSRNRDDLVQFLLDEIRASFTRGIKAGKMPSPANRGIHIVRIQ